MGISNRRVRGAGGGAARSGGALACARGIRAAGAGRAVWAGREPAGASVGGAGGYSVESAEPCAGIAVIGRPAYAGAVSTTDGRAYPILAVWFEHFCRHCVGHHGTLV